MYKGTPIKQSADTNRKSILTDSKVLCQKAYTKTSARDLLTQGTTSHLQQVNDTLCDILPEGQK